MKTSGSVLHVVEKVCTSYDKQTECNTTGTDLIKRSQNGYGNAIWK